MSKDVPPRHPRRRGFRRYHPDPHVGGLLTAASELFGLGGATATGPINATANPIPPPIPPVPPPPGDRFKDVDGSKVPPEFNVNKAKATEDLLDAIERFIWYEADDRETEAKRIAGQYKKRGNMLISDGDNYDDKLRQGGQEIYIPPQYRDQNFKDLLDKAMRAADIGISTTAYYFFDVLAAPFKQAGALLWKLVNLALGYVFRELRLPTVFGMYSPLKKAADAHRRLVAGLLDWIEWGISTKGGAGARFVQYLRSGGRYFINGVDIVSYGFFDANVVLLSMISSLVGFVMGTRFGVAAWFRAARSETAILSGPIVGFTVGLLSATLTAFAPLAAESFTWQDVVYAWPTQRLIQATVVVAVYTHLVPRCMRRYLPRVEAQLRTEAERAFVDLQKQLTFRTVPDEVQLLVDTVRELLGIWSYLPHPPFPPRLERLETYRSFLVVNEDTKENIITCCEFVAAFKFTFRLCQKAWTVSHCIEQIQQQYGRIKEPAFREQVELLCSVAKQIEDEVMDIEWPDELVLDFDLYRPPAEKDFSKSIWVFLWELITLVTVRKQAHQEMATISPKTMRDMALASEQDDRGAYKNLMNKYPQGKWAKWARLFMAFTKDLDENGKHVSTADNNKPYAKTALSFYAINKELLDVVRKRDTKSKSKAKKEPPALTDEEKLFNLFIGSLSRLTPAVYLERMGAYLRKDDVYKKAFKAAPTIPVDEPSEVDGKYLRNVVLANMEGGIEDLDQLGDPARKWIGPLNAYLGHSYKDDGKHQPGGTSRQDIQELLEQTRKVSAYLSQGGRSKDDKQTSTMAVIAELTQREDVLVFLQQLELFIEQDPDLKSPAPAAEASNDDEEEEEDEDEKADSTYIQPESRDDISHVSPSEVEEPPVPSKPAAAPPRPSPPPPVKEEPVSPKNNKPSPSPAVVLPLENNMYAPDDDDYLDRAEKFDKQEEEEEEEEEEEKPTDFAPPNDDKSWGKWAKSMLPGNPFRSAKPDPPIPIPLPLPSRPPTPPFVLPPSQPTVTTFPDVSKPTKSVPIFEEVVKPGAKTATPFPGVSKPLKKKKIKTTPIFEELVKGDDKSRAIGVLKSRLAFADSVARIQGELALMRRFLMGERVNFRLQGTEQGRQLAADSISKIQEMKPTFANSLKAEWAQLVYEIQEHGQRVPHPSITRTKDQINTSMNALQSNLDRLTVFREFDELDPQVQLRYLGYFYKSHVIAAQTVSFPIILPQGTKLRVEDVTYLQDQMQKVCKTEYPGLSQVVTPKVRFISPEQVKFYPTMRRHVFFFLCPESMTRDDRDRMRLFFAEIDKPLAKRGAYIYLVPLRFSKNLPPIQTTYDFSSWNGKNPSSVSRCVVSDVAATIEMSNLLTFFDVAYYLRHLQYEPEAPELTLFGITDRFTRDDFTRTCEEATELTYSADLAVSDMAENMDPADPAFEHADDFANPGLMLPSVKEAAQKRAKNIDTDDLFILPEPQ